MRMPERVGTHNLVVTTRRQPQLVVKSVGARYLPPAVVRAMEELGWLDEWYGAGNREAETPVHELRESAQRFGLPRRLRGQLLVTKLGRSWLHDIRVEQLIASVGSGTPHLVGRARACPPEDCGRPWGYEHLLEVLTDPNHEEHEHLLGWAGGAFDPAAFDLADTNANLERHDRHTRQRRMRTR